MKSKLLLGLALVLSGGLFDCFAGSSFDAASANDGFQLETEINRVEKAALDAALPAANWTNGVPWFALGNALEKLDRHYLLWATNTSIPPRLSKAVLMVFPSLTNASVEPELKGQMWCNAVRMLGLSHDPAMISVLRPYLKEKALADDPGGLGVGITTMRICDDAARAINSLLNLKLEFPRFDMFLNCHAVLTNGSKVLTWRSHSMAGDNAWTGSDPAWKEWDKKIAEIQTILDALPQNKFKSTAAKP